MTDELAARRTARDSGDLAPPPPNNNRTCVCGDQWWTITGPVLIDARDRRIIGWVVRIPGLEPFTTAGKARPVSELQCGSCGTRVPIDPHGDAHWPLGAPE